MNSDHQNLDTQYGLAMLTPAARPLTTNDGRQDPTVTVPSTEKDELPLLEDVIEPDDPVFSAWNAEQVRTRGDIAYTAHDPWQCSPDFESDILACKIRNDLADGLEQMVRTAVSTAIERSQRDLERALHAQLLESLESRLEEILPTLSEEQQFPKLQPDEKRD